MVESQERAPTAGTRYPRQFKERAQSNSKELQVLNRGTESARIGSLTRNGLIEVLGNQRAASSVVLVQTVGRQDAHREGAWREPLLVSVSQRVQGSKKIQKVTRRYDVIRDSRLDSVVRSSQEQKAVPRDVMGSSNPDFRDSNHDPHGAPSH